MLKLCPMQKRLSFWLHMEDSLLLAAFGSRCKILGSSSTVMPAAIFSAMMVMHWISEIVGKPQLNVCLISVALVMVFLRSRKTLRHLPCPWWLAVSHLCRGQLLFTSCCQKDKQPLKNLLCNKRTIRKHFISSVWGLKGDLCPGQLCSLERILDFGKKKLFREEFWYDLMNIQGFTKQGKRMSNQISVVCARYWSQRESQWGGKSLACQCMLRPHCVQGMLHVPWLWDDCMRILSPREGEDQERLFYSHIDFDLLMAPYSRSFHFTRRSQPPCTE